MKYYKVSGNVQKGCFLTRPAPARQDAPFPQARPQDAEDRVPKGATVVTSGAYTTVREHGKIPRTPLAAFFNIPY